PAGERGDLLVAELLKGLRGEGRAAPARAIHDQLAPAVADGLLDPGLERAARDVDRARDMALVPFVALADVDQQWCAAVQALPRAVDLGVRIDREARALRRGARLYNGGHRAQAGRIFAHYHSLQAEVGFAFSRWPDESLRAVQGLTGSNPRSAFAQFHLGLA